VYLEREDLIERIAVLSMAKMEEIVLAVDSAGLDPGTLLPRAI
jgi:hypothetical protein